MTRSRVPTVIRILVQGGVVVDVEGLPEGYVYDVIDCDMGQEACGLCYAGNCPHACHGMHDSTDRRQ
jgi:hypothetical protein